MALKKRPLMFFWGNFFKASLTTLFRIVWGAA